MSQRRWSHHSVSLMWMAAGFALWSVFVGRLAWLQLQQTSIFSAMAERNRSLWVTQRAPRGQIVDRTGKIVAENEIRYTQTVVENAQEREIPLMQEAAISLMATSPATVRKSYHRHYPFGPVLAQVVGYVQQPQLSTDVVTGRAGVERRENETLAGSDGFLRYEKNARGQATRILEQQEAQAGQPVKLTLDAELSQQAFAALGKFRGTVIVSAPDGEVLAAVSKPSFIPQTDAQSDDMPWKTDIEAGMVAESLQSALDFPHNPFLFRPIAALYPPGSTFKIVTALAGLEYEALTPVTRVLDEGRLVVGEFEYANWYWRQYGRVEGEIDVVRALARSNDIFFYKAAEWIGPERLAEFARLFAFGGKTGVDLPGEKEGIVPDPAWKQQCLGERWYLGNTYHMGIGQGDVLVTPMQVHEMMSTVAANGRRCAPRFLQKSAPVCQELSLNPESLAVVHQGLREVCRPGGTAFPFFSAPYDMLCKTGTAEFGAADEKGHRPTHAWFIAAVSDSSRPEKTNESFAPRIIVTVLIESSDELLYAEGSREAAPVAKAVIDWWWEHRRL